MKLFSDEQVLKIWWYLVGLMAGYKFEIMHGKFAPLFFFLFVCSIGFELSICIFSLKSWYVGKGNEWQQRIFLVHIVWSQFRWLNWFIITKYLIFIWHFTNWKLAQFLIPSIINILRDKKLLLGIWYWCPYQLIRQFRSVFNGAFFCSLSSTFFVSLECI